MKPLAKFLAPLITAIPILVPAVESGANANSHAHNLVSHIGAIEKINGSPNKVDLALAEFADKVENAGIKFFDLDANEVQELINLARKVPVDLGLFTDPKIESASREILKRLSDNPEVKDRIGHGYTALHIVARSTIDGDLKNKLATILLKRGANPNALTSPRRESVLDTAYRDPAFTKFLKSKM